MKFFKSHFALSRSQQNGIFLLVILIIVFQVIILFDIFPETEPKIVDREKIKNFQKQLDSLNRISERTKDTVYPFNPNYITDFKGYQLGMTVEEIDRLLAYRAAGKWINSPVDFKTVTGVSDSLLSKIEPSFRFPAWAQNATSSKVNKDHKKLGPAVIDLNSASAADLRKVNGIGEVLSLRIIKYRQSIGGFLSPIQLKDVYGLSPEVIDRIEERFRILTRPDITISNINMLTASELAEIPYINEQLAREIITYRSLHEGIRTFEELSKIRHFPSDKIDRIKLYLTIN